MGKMLDRFKGNAKKLDGMAQEVVNREPRVNSRKFRDRRSRRNPRTQELPKQKTNSENLDDEEFYDDFGEDYSDEVAVQPSQKPESFHHFILENQYKDLEKSIRGYKDVWDKKERVWITKRKDKHCFTDEEAEDLLRTAQSHLATDIKLSRINKDRFGEKVMSIYDQIGNMFEKIAEYRYGRYGSYHNQANMKMQNEKIFLELISRIEANYSRAIGGQENTDTHGSVKGQESLNSTDQDVTGRRGYG